jgi:hypothetical protein
LSSSFSLDDLREASAYQVDHYFVKPTDALELVAMVKRLAEYCQPREEPRALAISIPPEEEPAQVVIRSAA